MDNGSNFLKGIHLNVLLKGKVVHFTDNDLSADRIGLDFTHMA